MELDALQQIYSEVVNIGGKLIIFTPQLPEYSLSMAEERKLTFPIIQDKGQNLASALGIAHGMPQDLCELYLQFGINVPKSNGTDEWQLPMPARYLIDSQGIITNCSINPDYTFRPEPLDTLALLKGLK